MSEASQNLRRVHLNDLEDVLIFGIALLLTDFHPATLNTIDNILNAMRISIDSRAIPNIKTSPKSFRSTLLGFLDCLEISSYLFRLFFPEIQINFACFSEDPHLAPAEKTIIRYPIFMKKIPLERA